MSNEFKGSSLCEHFWLYEEKGELVALAELPKPAWAQYTLITDSKRCESSLERALLMECQRVMLERMVQNPEGELVLSTHVAATDLHRLDHLQSLGYRLKPSKRVVTLQSLNPPIPVPVVPHGFYIRSVAGENEANLVADVHKGSFGSEWTEAEYLKVMRTPGFMVERELVVVAPDDRFAAFLIYWLDLVSRTGLLEPVGCHEAFQRRGLTKALIYAAIARMTDAGMNRASVEYRSSNEAAAKLYASVGFKKHFKTIDCELHFDSK